MNEFDKLRVIHGAMLHNMDDLEKILDGFGELILAMEIKSEVVIEEDGTKV